MADESLSALNRRFNQLKRWEESETNRASHLPKEHPRKVKFHDGCVFLAACSSGDRDVHVISRHSIHKKGGWQQACQT
jgi:protein phosphatase 1 regulatory subunit 12A